MYIIGTQTCTLYSTISTIASHIFFALTFLLYLLATLANLVLYIPEHKG